jgi:DNA-binding CsgD family transcriptional regulator
VTAIAAPTPLHGSPDAAPRPVVLGTVHGDGTIGHFSSEVTDLLGYGPSDLLRRPASELVHPEDVAVLEDLAVLARHNAGGSHGQARFAAAGGGWVLCNVLLQPLAGQHDEGWAFALSPVVEDRDPDRARVRELEERLRRVAREVTASGVVSFATAMPTSTEAPELNELTAREYEIVVRLYSGERVPTIARRLFLSESTVRNHLTSVYRKFGVGSQVELVTRLRVAEPATSPAPGPLRPVLQRGWGRRDATG